jgi:hypothetical protein
MKRFRWEARGRLVGVAVGLAAGALLIPGAAAAHGPRHYFLRSNRAIRFQVQGSHGYMVGVAEGSRRHFEVTVRRGSATTEYERPASLPESRVDLRGDLGNLGTFDVRFIPRGKPHRLPRYRWCTGPGPTVQPGIVRGKIRFRGERGYTQAVAHSAAAELETRPGQRCHYGELGHSKHPPLYTATFQAAHEGTGVSTFFEALRFAPHFRSPARRVFYEAAAYDRRGTIRIIRKVRLAADTSTFQLPDFATAPETAVIEPGAPFTGSATFARTPESTFSWTGDLAIAFPGTDPLPLAGPDFRLHYCALHSCVDQESPEERDDFLP